MKISRKSINNLKALLMNENSNKKKQIKLLKKFRNKVKRQ